MPLIGSLLQCFSIRGSRQTFEPRATFWLSKCIFLGNFHLGNFRNAYFSTKMCRQIGFSYDLWVDNNPRLTNTGSIALFSHTGYQMDFLSLNNLLNHPKKSFFLNTKTAWLRFKLE